MSKLIRVFDMSLTATLHVSDEVIIYFKGKN